MAQPDHDVEYCCARPSVRAEVKPYILRLIGALPVLQAITVRSLGVPDVQHVSPLVELHASCKRRGLQFGLDFILDAQADPCAVLAQMPTSLRLIS